MPSPMTSPRAHFHRSARRVLTMEWVDGGVRPDDLTAMRDHGVDPRAVADCAARAMARGGARA